MKNKHIGTLYYLFIKICKHILCGIRVHIHLSTSSNGLLISHKQQLITRKLLRTESTKYLAEKKEKMLWNLFDEIIISHHLHVVFDRINP